EAAPLDDAEQPVAFVGVGTPLAQPLDGQREQAAEYQLGHGYGAEAGPVDLRLDAVPGAAVEVLLGGVERHLCPHWTVGLGERAYEAEVEGGVGEYVDHGRAGREYPVFDAYVRGATDDRVHRAVPPVHGAVVQGQLGQGRCLSPVEDLGRVLVLDDRQQGGEVSYVLLEQVEDRGDPALAEPHPRAYPLCFELFRPGVGGLFE